MAREDVAFFDIGETLGAVLEGAAGSGLKLQTFSYVPPVLERLRAKGVSLGVISNTGDIPATGIDAMLGTAGILQYFHPDLLIYSSVVGLKKDSPAIFELALGRAQRVVGQPVAVFVGESRSERAFA